MKELKSVDKLASSFRKIPGIGSRSAMKMSYEILNMKDEDVNELITALKEIKTKVHKCPHCGNYTEDEICEICADTNRDQKKLLVVSLPKDINSFEKLNSYNGYYHVLGGSLSAIGGINVEDLAIDSLIKKIDDESIEEIILATNPTIEGETTALYIAKLLENKNVNVTRLAYGLPMGGYLEYADSLTLLKALEGRKKIQGDK